MEDQPALDALGDGLRLPTRWRRPAADLAVLVAIGVLMGVFGPYGTDAMPPFRRHVYWMVCIVVGGLIGIACDRVIGRRGVALWPQVLLASLLMTPAVTVFVLGANHLMLNQRADLSGYLNLLWRVFAVSLPVMTVRALAWRRPARVVETRTIVETRTVVEPPLPTATATFRRRLSARCRGARLIAVEAHDHYLKVHTDAGAELITARFADALEDLAQAHGYRVHRSWWIAADAIEQVTWRRGVGEAQLAGGLRAAVSRNQASLLKDAGW